MLTGSRRAEVLVGPAGSGKTYTAACAARMWREAGMGEVYGLAVSQAARNVLHEAGVATADNIAEFLGHLAGHREARGAKPVARGTLLILDEASTVPVADLAAIVRLAADRDCRVLLCGDHEQLAAVEGGGAMAMLARQLGFAQLSEPVRFASEWERDASLRLRAGDAGRPGRLRRARPAARREPGGGSRPGVPGLRRRLPGRAGRAAAGPDGGAGQGAGPAGP